MQLYTKTGDKGLTKLVGGQSVAKGFGSSQCIRDY